MTVNLLMGNYASSIVFDTCPRFIPSGTINIEGPTTKFPSDDHLKSQKIKSLFDLHIFVT